MREGEYRNGKKHGPWKLYYPNGQLKRAKRPFTRA